MAKTKRCEECLAELEGWRTFCDCGRQYRPLVPGFEPVASTWLQAPRLAPGLHSQEVAGEGYRQAAIDRIAGGKTPDGARVRWHTAQLVPEPTNPFDKDALMVLIGRQLVGYIPSDETTRPRRLLAEGHRPLTVRAEIVGGQRRPGDGFAEGFETHYGVRLWLQPDCRIFQPGVDSFFAGYDVAVEVLPEAREAALALAGRAERAVIQVQGGVWIGVPGVWIGKLKPQMAERHGPLLHKIQEAGIPIVSNVSAKVGAKGQPLVKVELPSAKIVEQLLSSC